MVGFQKLFHVRPADWLERIEPLLFALVAGTWTLLLAAYFFESQHWQLGNAVAWANPGAYEPSQRGRWTGLWSAPLDDVFIHFDFARSTARGYPFEWIAGSGYSSGGTSALYPLVLALGWLVGFQGLTLMHFAATLATVSVLAILLGFRCLFSELPRYTSYLLPFVFLGVGALDWTMWSGMEVALFLALWAGCLVCWDAIVGILAVRAEMPWRMLVGLGLALLLTVATRPEALGLTFVFAFDLARRIRRRFGTRAATVGLLTIVTLPCLVTLGFAIANRLLTGSFAAAGALVKLEINNPLLTPIEVLSEYWIHLKYQLLRVTGYHLGNNPVTGWLVWGLGLLALVPQATRRYAGLLWSSLVLWTLIVSFNGQVRWQNERYSMPALAWLLAAATLGWAWLVASALRGRGNNRSRWTKGGLALVTLALVTWGQIPRLQQQRWFFGRASRNIFDQQVQAGYVLRHAIRPTPHRVLVGDAGAIPYVSDLMGLDLIGLGGTNRLPFARASQWGEAAAIELVQRISPRERPDAMAIYPTWWERLPFWFTSGRLMDVPVRGNVICGGRTKVIYRTDWSSLDQAEQPILLRPGEVIVDRLDFADLLSEQAHDFIPRHRAMAFVEMKLLPDPKNPSRDLWDAGREVVPEQRYSFTVRGMKAGRPARLVMRVTPYRDLQLRFHLKSGRLLPLELHPRDGWSEVWLDLPAPDVSPNLELSITSSRLGIVLYHLWAVQAP